MFVSGSSMIASGIKLKAGRLEAVASRSSSVVSDNNFCVTSPVSQAIMHCCTEVTGETEPACSKQRVPIGLWARSSTCVTLVQKPWPD